MVQIYIPLLVLLLCAVYNVIRNIALGCFYILNLYLEIFVFSQGLGLWVTGAKHNFKNSSATYIVAVIRVFEICRTEADRLSAGPIEASYLVVLLSAKPFVVVLYVMALPNMFRGY